MTGTTTGSRSSGVGTAGGVTEQAREVGGELTHTAQEQAGTVAHKVADRADERKAELAEQARLLEEKARQFARSIADEQPKVGDALERGTESADRLISWVESTPVEEMAQDLREQMRRHPMLFAAGMFGAGFALTRVLKPVDGDGASSVQQPHSTPAQQLPAASAIDGGVH